MRLALPEHMRPALDGLPGDVEVVWYRDGSDCPRAVVVAEVLWLNMWRTAEIEEALRAGDQLRWVSYPGVGVDSFPMDLFRERGLKLTNGCGLQATPIAEYVVMAVLAAAKGLPALLQSQARAEWLTRPAAARDLAGSSALVVGYGQIGQAVASRLRAFGVTVTGVRRHGSPGDPDVIGPDAWRARLVDYDWIVLSAPLTDQTRYLIGQTELAAMRPGAWIFNVARGSIVDHAALEAALRGQQIGGAYLDLTDPEPLPADSPLWHMPNVIITPHSSSSSPGGRQRTVDLFLDNLARYRDGRPLHNLVDLVAGY